MAESHPMVPGFVKPQPPKTLLNPKPLENQLWSVRAAARQKLDELSSAPSVSLNRAEAKLLLGTLISLIEGGGKAELQETAQQGLLTAMSGVVKRAAQTEEPA